MKENDVEYVIVGKVGSSYGVQGWVKIFTYTENPIDILKYKPWYLKSHSNLGHWRPITVEAGKSYKNHVIVRFIDYQTPEAVRNLSGNLIAIKKCQLPKLKRNEYYWSDLIGLRVKNIQGDDLGVVSSILETGANDVLIVKGKKEHGIPFIRDLVIKNIDLDAGVINVDWEII